MDITELPKRESPPAILLRESFWDSTEVDPRTLANLSSPTPGQLEIRDRTRRAVDAVPR